MDEFKDQAWPWITGLFIIAIALVSLFSCSTTEHGNTKREFQKTAQIQACASAHQSWTWIAIDHAGDGGWGCVK